jgi:hypothetical protein
MNDEQLNRKLEKLIRTIRTLGWVATGVGGCLLIVSVVYAIRSQVGFEIKATLIAGAIGMHLAGLVFLLQPREKIIASFRPIMRPASESSRSRLKQE